MQKKIKISLFIILTLFICNANQVEGKNLNGILDDMIEKKCEYVTPGDTIPAQQTSVLCDVFDDGAHQCWMQVGGGQASSSSNKEKILNWNQGVIGVPKFEYAGKCPMYLVATIDVAIGGYSIWGFNNITDAEKWRIDRQQYNTTVTLSLIKENIINEKPEEDGAEEEINKCVVFGQNTDKILKWVINFIYIAVPVIIIIMSIIEFAGIALSGDEKNFKAVGTKLIKRLIIGAVIIFLPILIIFLVDLSGVLIPYGIEPNQIFCSLF